MNISMIDGLKKVCEDRMLLLPCKMLFQVSRQKTGLAEELISARKEVERQSDTIVRIAKEKEELTHDKASLSVQLTASERECRQQTEVGLLMVAASALFNV